MLFSHSLKLLVESQCSWTCLAHSCLEGMRTRHSTHHNQSRIEQQFRMNPLTQVRFRRDSHMFTTLLFLLFRQFFRFTCVFIVIERRKTHEKMAYFPSVYWQCADQIRLSIYCVFFYLSYRIGKFRKQHNKIIVWMSKQLVYFRVNKVAIIYMSTSQ